MLNPCCCISPRIGTFIFAILDLIYAVGYTLDVLRIVFDHGNYGLWVEIGFCVVLIFLALLLLFGALQNSQEKVKLWLILWLIFVIVAAVSQGLNIWNQHRVGPRSGTTFGALLVSLYQIWVVYAYLTELRYGPSGLTYCPAQVV